jgi:hypothetical protein
MNGTFHLHKPYAKHENKSRMTAISNPGHIHHYITGLRERDSLLLGHNDIREQTKPYPIAFAVAQPLYGSERESNRGQDEMRKS